MGCLDEKTLSSYLDERISEPERNKIEAHVSQCNRCLDFLVLAYEAQGSKQKCPPLLKEKIKARLGLRQRKGRAELKWLFGALFVFALSFVFKRFFAQFLVAAAILGFKWVMEGESAKRAIMIFKGIEKSEKKIERKSTPPVSDISEDIRRGG